MQLSKYFFWNFNVNSITYQKHARLVIESVVASANLKDWHKLKVFYGLNLMKKEALQMRGLERKTLNFLSLIFKVPILNFRAYKKMPAVNTHCNY